MDFIVWLSFVAIATTNIVTPGPAILNTIRRATQLGLRKTIPTILGNALGLAVAGGFCAGGVATFVMASELLWTLFHWLGVGYLVWLGLKLIFVREELDLSGEARRGVPARQLFIEAFTLAVSNPKAVLFFVAIFPQVMDASRPVLPQAVILVSTFCAISIGSLFSYSTLASLLRGRFLTQRRYRVFRTVSGALLLGFAGKLAREVR